MLDGPYATSSIFLPMFILLYRYLKKKYDIRQQGGEAATQAASVPGPESNGVDTRLSEQHGGSSTKAELIRNILLMIGLAIPVFLETLDYTGASCNVSAILVAEPLHYFSGCNGSGSHCGMSQRDKLLNVTLITQSSPSSTDLTSKGSCTGRFKHILF